MDEPLGVRAVAPVFGTSDLGRWIEHYRRLGAVVETYEDVYGYATFDDVVVHVAVNPDHDPLHGAGCAYLHVADADALYERWAGATTDGRDSAPVDTPYGLREGAHIDPDNNLLRFGSPLRRA